jgi:hypothetical protein
VAGAAALYSSVHQATRGSAPTPQHVRSRLIATGSPQPGATPGHISPLPNLRALVADFGAAPPTGNLVGNPSFETAAAGWGAAATFGSAGTDAKSLSLDAVGGWAP